MSLILKTEKLSKGNQQKIQFMTAIYFILGYLAYALLYALTGSTVSKPEDIQSANTPVALLAVTRFYNFFFFFN